MSSHPISDKPQTFFSSLQANVASNWKEHKVQIITGLAVAALGAAVISTGGLVAIAAGCALAAVGLAFAAYKTFSSPSLPSPSKECDSTGIPPRDEGIFVDKKGNIVEQNPDMQGFANSAPVIATDVKYFVGTTSAPQFPINADLLTILTADQMVREVSAQSKAGQQPSSDVASSLSQELDFAADLPALTEEEMSSIIPPKKWLPTSDQQPSMTSSEPVLGKMKKSVVTASQPSLTQRRAVEQKTQEHFAAQPQGFFARLQAVAGAFFEEMVGQPV